MKRKLFLFICFYLTVAAFAQAPNIIFPLPQVFGLRAMISDPVLTNSGAAASFSSPQDIVIDVLGNIYISQKIIIY